MSDILEVPGGDYSRSAVGSIYFNIYVLITFELPPRYNWNIVESDVKHHKPILLLKSTCHNECIKIAYHMCITVTECVIFTCTLFRSKAKLRRNGGNVRVDYNYVDIVCSRMYNVMLSEGQMFDIFL